MTPFPLTLSATLVPRFGTNVADTTVYTYGAGSPKSAYECIGLQSSALIRVGWSLLFPRATVNHLAAVNPGRSAAAMSVRHVICSKRMLALIRLHP